MNLQLGRHSLKAEEIENLKSRQFQKFNQLFIQIRIPKAIWYVKFLLGSDAGHYNDEQTF